MKVSLRVYSSLNEYLQPDQKNKTSFVCLPTGSDLLDLLNDAGIPQDRVMFFVVNKRTVTDIRQELHDNDSVELYPVVYGG